MIKRLFFLTGKSGIVKPGRTGSLEEKLDVRFKGVDVQVDEHN